LSAQCSVDRIRLQYSPQDIAAYADRQSLKRAIASAQSLHRFFAQVEGHLDLVEDVVHEKK